MAADQRYCLQCGARRGERRVAVDTLEGGRIAPPAPPPPDLRDPARSGSEWTPLTAIGLVSVIALILVAGVLIGRGIGGSDDPASQVVTVGSGTATAASNTGGGSFKADWPSGKTGYTVELGTLDKASATAADVAGAKKDATDKGAPDVGALDSDDYGSLPSGSYVLYSGVYAGKDGKAAASKALKKLKGKFADAKVVKVSAGGGGGSSAGGAGEEVKQNVDPKALESLDKVTGDDYVKQSKKLPDDTAIGGKAPPTDKKAPGGGSQALDIK